MYSKPLLLLLIVLISKSACSNSICSPQSSVDISEGTHLPNGDIYFNGVQYDNSEYYKNNETGIERGCICKKETCIRKCCPYGYGYNSKKKVCVKVTEVFNPPVWDEYNLLEGVNATKVFHVLTEKMNCTPPDLRLQVGKGTKDYHLRSDGSLYVALPNNIPPWMVRDADHYCIDTFVTEDSSGVSTHLDALICFADEQDNRGQYIPSSACMLISCIFILATVAVYAWLPELRNLHGRVLMAYLLCLFVGFAFLASMQILLVINNITLTCCTTLTFIIYFALLAAFFWLNVMCFDIWWTFSGKRGLSLEKLSVRGRFVAYSFYAFGIPTALTIILAGLEFSGLPPHPLMPMLRTQGCFIYGKSKLLYLYGPIVILCIANMIFFILTAVKITQIKKETSVLKSKESSTHDPHRNDRQRFLLYMKLFSVMGINWILEVVSAIYPELENVWRITDAYNVLIGVIIFIIFVCKRKIYRLIKKRQRFHSGRLRSDQTMEKRHHEYKQLRGDPMSRTQTTTSTRTMSIREDMQLGSIKHK